MFHITICVLSPILNFPVKILAYSSPSEPNHPRDTQRATYDLMKRRNRLSNTSSKINAPEARAARAVAGHQAKLTYLCSFFL